MSFPADVLLPVDAKYFGFIDSKFQFDSNWDIVWSFQYSLSGSQHGFCTFLTTNSYLSSGVPGHYLGYLEDTHPYILGEDGDTMTTESGEILTYADYASNGGVLSIAFDTTGYFALSNSTNPGISMTDVKPNSLIVRDSDKNVIFNQSLSTIDSDFVLTENSFKTLRFRYEGCGKRISIDWRKNDTYFRNLTTIQLRDVRDTINTKLYPGFCYCSPISSSSLSASTLMLKNFHVQGNVGTPTNEIVTFVPLTSLKPTEFTQISSI